MDPMARTTGCGHHAVEGGGTPDGDPRIREIVELAFRFVGELRGHFEACAAAGGLTPPQGHALRVLDAPVPMSGLAEHLRCDASNVTGIVDRLEEQGLVRRVADPRDRRRKTVVLTDAGTAARLALRDRIFHGHPVLARLSPGDLSTLRELLARALGGDPPVPSDAPPEPSSTAG